MISYPNSSEILTSPSYIKLSSNLINKLLSVEHFPRLNQSETAAWDYNWLSCRDKVNLCKFVRNCNFLVNVSMSMSTKLLEFIPTLSYWILVRLDKQFWMWVIPSELIAPLLILTDKLVIFFNWLIA